jgi:hypothetical protein
VLRLLPRLCPIVFLNLIPTGGDANITVCSNKNIAGCTTFVGNAAAAGGVSVIGFNLPDACSTSKVEYIVKTPDASVNPIHHYALGIFCQSGSCTPGTLYVQTAVLPSGTGQGTFTPTSGLVTQNWQTVDSGKEGGVPAFRAYSPQESMDRRLRAIVSVTARCFMAMPIVGPFMPSIMRTNT